MMDAKTQGRDGIAMTKVRGVARRLSVVSAMFVTAALVAGTGYAGGKKPPVPHEDLHLEDTVTVTNFGSSFGGSVSTYAKTTGKKNPAPAFSLTGPNTLLGASTGPAGDAVSSLDDHIAVAIPIDLIDLSGFGEPPIGLICTGPGTSTAGPIPCCTGLGKGTCKSQTGFVELYAQGSTGNSAPESFIGTRLVTFGFPNFSGVNTPQGVAFEDPFDGVNKGKDIVAITNTLSFVLQSEAAGGGGKGSLSCNAVGSAGCTGPGVGKLGEPMPCCSSLGKGSCIGFSLGTVTLFDRMTLSPGFNDLVPPFNNSPVDECIGTSQVPASPLLTDGECDVCPPPGKLVCLPPGKIVNGLCTGNQTCSVPPIIDPTGTNPDGSVPYNASIGGCLTFLLGPVGDAFDAHGNLFVVNEATVAQGGLGYVTAYAIGRLNGAPPNGGDQLPRVIIGALPGSSTPAGTFTDPVYIAIAEDPAVPTCAIPALCPHDVVFVTDVGNKTTPPSIKIFAAFTNLNSGLFFAGTPLGTIKGSNTKLKRPEGIAVQGDDLYVVNTNANTLAMFDDFTLSGGNIAPTLQLSGKSSKMNFPVGVALHQLYPTPTATATRTANGAELATPTP